MKKSITYLILAFTLLTYSSKSAIIMVEVEDFEFTPSIFNVNVGDTITWFWTEGFHTTTSTNIPVGAAPWDQAMSAGSPMFSYVVTTAGSYDFQCTPHASMGMLGHFTASVVTGVDEIPSQAFLNIKGNMPGTEQITISYGLPQQSLVSLVMYDILGNPVRLFNDMVKPAGLFEESISVEGIAKGIYIVELISPASRVSRKIMIR